MLTIKNKVRLQVRDIIRYLCASDYIIIEQLDVYAKDSPDGDESEEIYNGTVFDIPWYIMDYYLANTADVEAIGTCKKTFLDGRTPVPALWLSVVEDEDRLDERYN